MFHNLETFSRQTSGIDRDGDSERE